MGGLERGGDGPRELHGSATGPAKLEVGAGVCDNDDEGLDVEACAIALEAPSVVSRSFCLEPLGGPNLMLAGALNFSVTFGATVFEIDCVADLTEREAEGML